MFNSYYLRYRLRFGGQDTFHTMEILGHYRKNGEVRRDFERFCPVMFQDRQSRERLRFKLLSVTKNERGSYDSLGVED